VLLYIICYFKVYYEYMPSIAIQIFTLVWYGLAIEGVVLTTTRKPRQIEMDSSKYLLRLKKYIAFLVVFTLAGVLIKIAIPNFFFYWIYFAIFWTPIGFVLFIVAFYYSFKDFFTSLKSRKDVII